MLGSKIKDCEEAIERLVGAAVTLLTGLTPTQSPDCGNSFSTRKRLRLS